MPGTKEELSAAMHRLYDALAFMRGPTGEVIYIGEKALHIAFHLARAGCDVNPDQAIIKRRPIPARVGMGLPGMVDWVPVEWPDVELPPEGEVSACGPMPDPSMFDDLLEWHTRTRIEGSFK